MSRPFQSFARLNRSWDIRFLETHSLRSAFLLLLLAMFALGMLSFMLLYDMVRLGRVDWTAVFLVPVFTVGGWRYSRLIYRRLGR